MRKVQSLIKVIQDSGWKEICFKDQIFQFRANSCNESEKLSLADFYLIRISLLAMTHPQNNHLQVL